MSEWTVPHQSDTVPDEAILESARRVVADLEYVPSRKEMCEHGKYSRRAYSERFDGYGAMLIRARIVEEHPETGRRPVPTEAVLADIRWVRDDLGRWPKSYEYNGRGTYSWQLLGHRLDEGWASNPGACRADGNRLLRLQTPHVSVKFPLRFSARALRHDHIRVYASRDYDFQLYITGVRSQHQE